MDGWACLGNGGNQVAATLLKEANDRVGYDCNVVGFAGLVEPFDLLASPREVDPTEPHDHLAPMTPAARQRWTQAQEPWMQAAILRVLLALAARNAGHELDAAWALACGRVPQGRTSR